MVEQPPFPTSQVGKTKLRVTRLGFGCVPLGNYPNALSDAAASDALATAYSAGIRFFDVAPLYGHGLAEHRLGAFLRGRSRREYGLSTKVGRLLIADPSGELEADPMAGIFEKPLAFALRNDYSHDGIMRSVEDSLQRLGLPSVDILHIHNIDPNNHAPAKIETLFRQCMSDGYRALERLRREGTVKALGVGNNSWAMCARFAAEGDFDCFMMAGSFNLLNQEAIESFLPDCLKRGSSILLGSPFASGLLAADDPANSRYMYGAPSDDVLQKVRVIRGICADHGVSPIAAALHFPFQHASVACVVAGMRTAEEVTGCVAEFRKPVPEALFADFRQAGIIDPRVGLENR